MELYYEILKVLVPLVVVPLLAVVGQEVRRYYRARLTAEQRHLAQLVINTTVTAAEQLYRTQSIQDRYQFARQRAREELAELGIQVSDRDLETFIEATVLQLRDFFLSLPESEQVVD